MIPSAIISVSFLLTLSLNTVEGEQGELYNENNIENWRIQEQIQSATNVHQDIIKLRDEEEEPVDPYGNDVRMRRTRRGCPPGAGCRNPGKPWRG